MATATNFLSNVPAGTTDIACGRFTAGLDLYPWTNDAGGHQIKSPGAVNVQRTGESAWQLITESTLAEATEYFENCVTNGIDLVMVMSMNHFSSVSPGQNTPVWRNKNGDLPFNSEISTNNPDFTDPNPAYWNDFVAKVNAANARGIMIAVAPCYVGFNEDTTQGWAGVMSVNGTANMTTFGTFFGNLCKDLPNIIYIAGGDSPPITVGAHTTAMMDAIAAVDTVHLRTGHSNRTQPAWTEYGGNAWFTSNNAYTSDTGITTECFTEWNRTGPLPFGHIEAVYGSSIDGITDEQIIRQYYQSTLSGAVYFIAGFWDIWDFRTTWRDALSLHGRQYIQYLSRLKAARDIMSLTPDQTSSVSTTGEVTAADTSQSITYINPGGSTTIALSNFSAGVTARWYSPINGTSQAAGTFSNVGTQAFTPPDANAWVLLISLTSLGLGDP